MLDIIGVVDILMNNGNRVENDLIPTYASFSIIDNTIHLETDGQIAGYQLLLRDVSDNLDISTQTAMELSTKKLDRDLIIVSYSLSENFLDQNTESILEISGDISNIEIIDLIVSDRRGNPVSSTLTHSENKNLPNTFSLDQNYPNPFNNLTSISYRYQKIRCFFNCI